MKNKRTQTLVIAMVLIAVFAFGAYNIQAGSMEYDYHLSQLEYTGDVKAPNFAAEGNKALFDADLIEEKKDVQLDIGLKLKENLIGSNVDVSGDGCLIVDNNKYPFTINEGELEQIKTESKRLYYTGGVDGYIEINSEKREISMAIDIVPGDDDVMMSMIIGSPGGMAALVFGEPFAETMEYLGKLAKENQKVNEGRR